MHAARAFPGEILTFVKIFQKKRKKTLEIFFICFKLIVTGVNHVGN